MQLPPCLTVYQERINAVLNACLPSPDTEPKLLHQAMRYCVLGGGKRLRPLLAYVTGEMFAAEMEVLDNTAAALELIHAYSLIHDDLPAMDNDDLRHGRPSCHRVYGEAIAILVGDALQSFAFELLARPSAAISLSQQLVMIRTLAEAIGSQGMVAGQVLDMTAMPENIFANNLLLDAIHQRKTGALIVASVSLGALAGNCQDTEKLLALKKFATCLGLAFQIHDDILDSTSTTQALGKTQGSDAVNNKASYPAIFGLQASLQRALMLYQESLACLQQVNLQSEALGVLAEFAVSRSC